MLTNRALPKKQPDEHVLFLKRAFKNPQKMGALFPSSTNLSKFIAKKAFLSPELRVLEIGGGTGRLTQGLINQGVCPSRLWIIEKDAYFYEYLSHKFKEATVLCGDAFDLCTVVPPEIIGTIDVIVSGIPLLNFSKLERERLVEACFRVLKPTGRLIQFSYQTRSPLDSITLSLIQKKLGYVFFNLPPATIWQYTRSISI